MEIIYWNVKAIHAIIFLWSYLTFAQFLKSGTMQQQHNANTFGASIIYTWLSYLVDYPNKNFLYSNEVHFLISLLESLRLTQNAHGIQAFASTPDALLRLQLEYTRLFIQDGKRPAAAPPYASFYLEHRLWGESTEEIMRLYKTHGFNLPPNEIPDALCWELAFLAHVAEQGDMQTEGLMLQHMRTWFPIFQEYVETHAEHIFYPTLVKLIQILIQKEDS
jgi:TorA maturation chaperone TorD